MQKQKLSEYLKGKVVQLLGTKIGLDLNTTDNQAITLSAGNKFIITDVVLKNSSININTAVDLQFWDGLTRSGNKIAITNYSAGVDRSLARLVAPTNFVNSNAQGSIADNNHVLMNGGFSTIGTTIYATLLTGQGVPATIDVYFYGYVLE